MWWPAGRSGGRRRQELWAGRGGGRNARRRRASASGERQATGRCERHWAAQGRAVGRIEEPAAAARRGRQGEAVREAVLWRASPPGAVVAAGDARQERARPITGDPAGTGPSHMRLAERGLAVARPGGSRPTSSLLSLWCWAVLCRAIVYIHHRLPPRSRSIPIQHHGRRHHLVVCLDALVAGLVAPGAQKREPALPFYLPIHLPVCLSAYLPTCPPACLPTCH